MLGRLGAGGGEQPDHLRHRVKNRATGLHSGESVLYCALCLQPPNLAQGRDLLTRVLDKLHLYVALSPTSQRRINQVSAISARIKPFSFKYSSPGVARAAAFKQEAAGSSRRSRHKCCSLPPVIHSETRVSRTHARHQDRRRFLRDARPVPPLISGSITNSSTGWIQISGNRLATFRSECWLGFQAKFFVAGAFRVYGNGAAWTKAARPSQGTICTCNAPGSPTFRCMAAVSPDG
jgi:hypothetical protein